MFATTRPKLGERILEIIEGFCGTKRTLASVTTLGAGNLTGALASYVVNSLFLLKQHRPRPIE